MGSNSVMSFPDRLPSLPRLLLHWKKQGIFLAVCSQNNLEDVREVFRKHDGMILTNPTSRRGRSTGVPKRSDPGDRTEAQHRQGCPGFL